VTQVTGNLPVTNLNSGTSASALTFWRGDGTWSTPAGAGTVTSVAQSFTGGLISVSGSPIVTSGTLALTVAGTSGGIPYFSSASTWATSAALAAGSIVVGGGAGATPATTATGTGVVTALGTNVGSAGAFVVNGGALGTPSSGTVTNLTGTATININGTVGATTANTGAFTTVSASGAIAANGGSITTTVANAVIDLDNTNSSSAQIRFGTDLYGSDSGLLFGLTGGGGKGIKAGGGVQFYCGTTRAGASGGVEINSSGNTNITGALSKGSGSFRIPHPLPTLAATHQLVHSFIEGPQADLIYRGKVNLVDGKATVNIDTAATMTEGTFVILCRDVQCFTSNETDWNHVRGSVKGNILTVDCQDSTSTALISWMVIGERQDKHMMETEWTDDIGRVIVEPLKQDFTL
jgi:hypothetical protein